VIITILYASNSHNLVCLSSASPIHTNIKRSHNFTVSAWQLASIQFGYQQILPSYHEYYQATFPSNPGSPIINSNQAASNSVFSATFPVKITMPVRIPSPSNDPIYYLFQNAFTSYHALIYQKQQPCKTTNMIKNLTIRQHNTTYYLTSEQYFLSFRNELTKAPQFFSATQNIDCSWTFKSV